jgi:hypothetical protein
MSAAVIEPVAFRRPLAAPSRNAAALQSLMHDWARESVDEEESETELMVMLSGMVGASAMSLGDE